MKKLIKLFLSVVIISLIIIPSAITVSATEERVFDNAGLFSAEEIASLESKIQELKSTYSHDFVIVTTNDLNGMSKEDFAESFYFSNNIGVGENSSGSSLLIDMGSREFDIFKKGQTNVLVKNNNRDKIVDKVGSQLSAGNYYDAAMIYLDDMSYYIQSSGNKLTGGEVLIGLLISLAIGGIFIGVVRHKYGFAGPQIAYPLRENSTLNLTKKEDVFINKTVTFVTIPASNSSSGGSGGGSSHGGGKF